MRYAIAVLLLSSVCLAQSTCTTYQSPNLPWPSTNINCSDGSSAVVRPLYSLPNLSVYSVDVVTPPSPTVPVYVPPPVVRPVPLPALAVQPPTMNTNLTALAIMAASNRPPSARQVRKWCKKRSGQTWVKRNWQGVVVDQGTCNTRQK